MWRTGEGGEVPHKLTIVIGKADNVVHVRARCRRGQLCHCSNFARVRFESFHASGDATFQDSDDVAEEAALGRGAFGAT